MRYGIAGLGCGNAACQHCVDCFNHRKMKFHPFLAPMLPLYPNVSPEIITIAIGSGAIGCTIVTDSLFWLVKQYCGATLNETFKYYTTATFIASVIALACTFLLSFII